MQRFIKFLLTSGLASGVNIAARAGLSYFIAYEAAIILAHILGMIIAYWLARHYVFEPSGQPMRREMIGFIGVNILSLGQVFLVSVGFFRYIFPAIGWAYQAELVAHLIGVGSLIFTSYFAHQLISFKPASASNP